MAWKGSGVQFPSAPRTLLVGASSRLTRKMVGVDSGVNSPAASVLEGRVLRAPGVDQSDRQGGRMCFCRSRGLATDSAAHLSCRLVVEPGASSHRRRSDSKTCAKDSRSVGRYTSVGSRSWQRRGGDAVETRDRFLSFYDDAVDPLYRYLHRATGGDRALAEDIAQEVFAIALLQ